MRMQLAGGVLEDPRALAAADPGDMLRQVASAAAQVREAQLATAEAGIARLAREGRPRAVVVAGMGGSAVSGDVLAAVAGIGCAVPIMTVRGYRLPGWVGAADLVMAVSCSGGTEETLSVAAEAARRGCRLLCVGAKDSPLAHIAAQARAPFVPVRSVGQPRATLWGLTVPLLLAMRELRLVDVPDEVFEATAARLEDVSHRCRPSSEPFLNPGKQLALDLMGSVPVAWGTSALAGVAAYRFACQCSENAKYPAIHGELPEADHNQVVAFDGPFARQRAADEDFFRDRSEDSEAGLHLLLLRDVEEHPQVAKRCAVSTEMAQARGVPVTEIKAEGDHPLERIATLMGFVDYATVYLAIALGIDPTPVLAIEELKARIAER